MSFASSWYRGRQCVIVYQMSTFLVYCEHLLTGVGASADHGVASANFELEVLAFDSLRLL